MGVIIAGTSSGVGKTTVTMALMSALNLTSDSVVPFKIGPDYIDPKFHKAATGRDSRNLDTWLHDPGTLRYLYNRQLETGDYAVVEGVMGLYDGLGISEAGSTALAAKILDLPVILVLDGKSLSRSAAAMVEGFANFDKSVSIRGVILNNLSGERHYGLIKLILEKESGVPCIGYFPREKEFSLPSRHLGLVPVEERKSLAGVLEKMAARARETIDLEFIRGLARHNYQTIHMTEKKVSKSGIGLSIGIPVDRAFNFYYRDNLDLMEEAGINLVPFDFLEDSHLPREIDGLYIGGGFPEVYALELSNNSRMLADVKSRADSGMPVYAECGGLMVLTRGIHGEGGFYPMAGFFQCESVMTSRLQRFGYIELEYEGISVRGHEFHYSRLDQYRDEEAVFKYKVEKPGRNSRWECGLSKKNVLAGYPHIHFYNNFQFFEKIISLYRSGSND